MELQPLAGCWLWTWFHCKIWPWRAEGSSNLPGLVTRQNHGRKVILRSVVEVVHQIFNNFCKILNRVIYFLPSIQTYVPTLDWGSFQAWLTGPEKLVLCWNYHSIKSSWWGSPGKGRGCDLGQGRKKRTNPDNIFVFLRFFPQLWRFYPSF